MKPRPTVKTKSQRQRQLQDLKRADRKRRANALDLHNTSEVQRCDRILANRTAALRRLAAS